MSISVAKLVAGALAPALIVMAAPALAQKQDGGVIGYAANDVEMNAARAEARRTLPQFFAALTNPAADEGYFMLKFDLLASPDEAEHIWAEEIAVADDGTITGVLANVPLADGFRVGQRVTIARDAISDWGFLRGRVMQGNFTTRVMLHDMPAAQAGEIKQSLGW